MSGYSPELSEKKRIDEEKKALEADGARPTMGVRNSSRHVESGEGDDDDSSLGKGEIKERQLSWQRAAVLL